MLRAVSSVYGKIHTLLYSLQATDRDRPLSEISAGLASLMAVMPDVHYTVAMVLPNSEAGELAHPSLWQTDVEQHVKSILLSKQQKGSANIFPVYVEPESIGLVVSEAGRTITPWVQDSVSVLEESHLPGIPILLERSTAMRNRSVNELLVDTLALNTEALMKPWTCAIDGGDVLVGDTYALIPQGVRSVGEKSFPLDVLRNTLGVSSLIEIARPSEISGYLRHLDLFITLGGKLENNKELVFVGTVEKSFVNTGSPLTANSLPLKKRLQKYLDSVAAALEAETAVAFQVERIPLVVEYRKEKDSLSHWIYSYNNCLVEVYPDSNDKLVRNAYLPRYDFLSGLQAEAESAFSKHNFDVQSLQADFVNVAQRKGSLHCLTKELRRLPFS